MKFKNGTQTLVIATVFLHSVLGSWSEFSYNDLRKPVEILLAKTISNQLMIRLEEEFRNVEEGETGRVHLLPPADDPAIIEAGEQLVNITLYPGVNLIGTAALTEPAVVTGLSQMVDNLNISYSAIGGLTIRWWFGVPLINLDGVYDLELILQTLYQNDRIIGYGDLLGSVKNVFVHFYGKGRAPLIGKMALHELNVELGFSEFSIDAGYMSGDDGNTTVDWTVISKLVNTAFALIWNDQTRPIVNEMIRCQIDYVVNDCNIFQLFPRGTTTTPTPSTVSSVELEKAKKECLKMDLNPSCFLPDATTDPTTSQTVSGSPETTVSGDTEATTTTGKTPTSGAINWSYSMSVLAILQVLSVIVNF